MITSRDLLAAREATRPEPPSRDRADCVRYAGLRADLEAAGDAPRVTVSTEEVRHLLRAYDQLTGPR